MASRDRANLAAETETVRTANRAAKIAYKQNDMERVMWRTNSAKPCQFCRTLDGKTVRVNEAFTELGDELEGEDGGKITVGHKTLSNPPAHARYGCFVEHERT